MVSAIAGARGRAVPNAAVDDEFRAGHIARGVIPIPAFATITSKRPNCRSVVSVTVACVLETNDCDFALDPAHGSPSRGVVGGFFFQVGLLESWLADDSLYFLDTDVIKFGDLRLCHPIAR